MGIFAILAFVTETQMATVSSVFKLRELFDIYKKATVKSWENGVGVLNPPHPKDPGLEGLNNKKCIDRGAEYVSDVKKQKWKSALWVHIVNVQQVEIAMKFGMMVMNMFTKPKGK